MPHPQDHRQRRLQEAAGNAASSITAAGTTGGGGGGGGGVVSIVDANGKIIKLTSGWTIVRGTTLEFVTGPAATFGPVTYQAVVAPISSPQDVSAVLQALRSSRPWDTAVTPFAYRYEVARVDGSDGGGGGAAEVNDGHALGEQISAGGGGDDDGGRAAAMAFREGCRDSDAARHGRGSGGGSGSGSSNNNRGVEDFGAGQKLLNILRGLDVSNVLLVAARWVSKTFSGPGARSPGRYAALTTAAHNGLGRCYARWARDTAAPALVLPPRRDRLLKRRKSRLAVSVDMAVVGGGGGDAAAAARGRQLAKAKAAAKANHYNKQNHGTGGIDGDRPRQHGSPWRAAGRGPAAAAGSNRVEAAARAAARAGTAPAEPSAFQADIPGPFGTAGASLAGRGNFAAQAPAAAPPPPAPARKPVFREEDLKPRFVPLLDVPAPSLSRRDLHHLCAFNKPPESLLKVLQCVCMLRARPCDSWEHVLDMLRREGGQCVLRPLDLRRVPRHAIAATRSFLLSEAYTPDDIRRHSKLGIVIYDFLVHVISVVDFIRTGRPPPGSIWVDSTDMKKVPVDIKLLVMDVDHHDNFQNID